MTRCPLRLGVLCAWIVLALMLPTSLARAISAEEQATLDRANERWQGARCRTRTTLEVKGKNNDWVKCRWFKFGPDKNFQKRVLVKVSDGRAVHRAFSKGIIPPGTEMRALGWIVENNNVVLELEMVAIPVRLKVYYFDWIAGGMNLVRVGVGKLADFEYWVTGNLLDVLSTPSEQLVEVSATAAVLPRSNPDPPPSVQPPVIVTDPPTVDIVAVAAQPARVPAGGHVELVITYRVGGAPQGSGFEVIERREIRSQGRVVATFEERPRRANGNVVSRLPVELPVSTAPGIYTLEVHVVMTGSEASGTALFEVVASAPASRYP